MRAADVTITISSSIMILTIISIITTILKIPDECSCSNLRFLHADSRMSLCNKTLIAEVKLRMVQRGLAGCAAGNHFAL